MQCHCTDYLNPIKTTEEIQARCNASDILSVNLVEVASDFVNWVSIFQCKTCKRYWAREYYLGEKLGNNIDCFYHIQCHQPQQWLKEHQGKLRWLHDKRVEFNGE